jgi:hypothetical protein
MKKSRFHRTFESVIIVAVFTSFLNADNLIAEPPGVGCTLPRISNLSCSLKLCKNCPSHFFKERLKKAAFQKDMIGSILP